MNIIHLHRSDFRTSAWSGGTTTELYLYPEDGSYARRDFRLRISSATVELPESDFTLLPDVERYITPLEGGFTLIHPGQSPVTLAPLAAPYRFSGQTETHCIGRARDFNLMLKGCSGSMELREGTARISPGFFSLYPLCDMLVQVGGRCCHMQREELLVVTGQEEAVAEFQGKAICCWAEI